MKLNYLLYRYHTVMYVSCRNFKFIKSFNYYGLDTFDLGF